MKKALAVVGMNLIIFGFLIFLLNVASIAIIAAYNWQKPKQYAQSHLFPNYRDDPESAKLFFTEYDNLTKGYYESFYEWRRPEFKSQTINIDENGLRRTFRPEGAEPDKTIAFFGGSTTWGTGGDDFATIPSFFGKQMPDYKAINFGETGYIAHQSMNLFMKWYFDGFRPDVVVFYDGVNDTWNKCRRELTSFSHSRERAMRIALQEGGETNSESFSFLFLPMKNLAGKIARTLESRSREASEVYDCDKDPEKAERIARVMVSDWLLMKSMVESYGGKFIAILQPHAYVSKTNLDHLKLDPELGLQYDAVYPRVVDLINGEFSALQDNFVDLRDALDKDDYFYIDWCHLSPNGNEIIAGRIADVVRQRTDKTAALR